MRTADYGDGYGLAMLIFGEFNVFKPRDAEAILKKAHAALVPGGVLLLEAHTFEAVRAMGERDAHWYSAPSGVFADKPYLCLRESFWHPDHAATTERYFVVDAQTGVVRYASSMQAYTDAEYRALLSGGRLRRHPVPPVHGRHRKRASGRPGGDYITQAVIWAQARGLSME